jgi:hypothetical protein
MKKKMDSIKIHFINYYDSKKSEFIRISQTEIEEKYPELSGWITTKSYSLIIVSNRRKEY